MRRFARFLVPAAVLATGTLLSACGVSGAFLGDSGSASPSVSSTDDPNGGQADVLGGPVTVASKLAAPQPGGTPVPPTATITAQTWADLLASGAVTTTAASPSIVGSATPAAPSTVPRGARTASAKNARAVSHEKVVYLTFDDGPSAVYTKRVLSLLATHHAHATFFVIGKQAQSAPATLRAELRSGNVIGNHTWTHRSLAGTSWATFAREVGRVQRAVKFETGVAPKCLRPPDGAMDKHTVKRAAKFGLGVQLWTIDTRDWANPSSTDIAKRVVNQVHPGSIVLMHDGGGNRTHTVRALDVILTTLAARGYVFKSLCG